MVARRGPGIHRARHAPAARIPGATRVASWWTALAGCALVAGGIGGLAAIEPARNGSWLPLVVAAGVALAGAAGCRLGVRTRTCTEFRDR